MKLRKLVGQGERIHNWYGVAWRELAWNGVVTYPIPLNLVLAFLRWLWILCKRPPEAIMADPREAYWQGRDAERKEWQASLASMSETAQPVTDNLGNSPHA